MATPSSAAPLTLKRVLLSSGGVGYFEYEAQVEGATELTLEAPLNQMDDILKSLIVYDDLGAVNTITLPGKESLDQIFRDLPFNAAALASPVELLNTLQGAEVEIKGSSALKGRLLKVTADTVLLPDKLGSTTRHRITVMTPQGLQQAILEDIEALRFTDPVLQEQVQKALTAVSEHRAQNSRTLRVHVKGAGKRTVRAGYVVEAPLWKTSYRLNLGASAQPNTPVQSRLQGWALLENMSGQDWEGVELTLASGNPVTFRQALYQAYFVKRPEVPVEVLGRVLPRLDTGTVAMELAKPLQAAPPPAAMAAQALQDSEERTSASENQLRRSFDKQMYGGVRESASDAAHREPATGTEGVEQVLFTLPTPVSVKNGYAVLLPIADRNIPTLRVSLFQPSTQANHPLASVQLTNDTPTSLPPGVITIYERMNYLGDGRLSALPVGDKRLVSFALDTKVNVNKTEDQTSTVSQGKISDGVFRSTTLEKATTTYRIKSLHADDRLLWIEQPQQGDWKLVAPDPATVQLTPDAYRVPQVLKKNAETQTQVVLQYNLEEVIALTDLNAEQLMAYAASSELGPTLKQAFAKLGEWRGQTDALKREIDQAEEQRQALFKDQERLRENLTRAPANSDLAKRYLKKLDAQENALEGLNASTQEKRGALDKLEQQLAQYLRGLSL
ncbi:MAG TPA: hypothetical protein PK880_08340 [Candidatus Competibacter sp.]|nr:hypothetical protein [Candidatus Competibacteraceae bacterium]HRC72529.1 hypothetical protein [Candidatus Competibacter sp.]